LGIPKLLDLQDMLNVSKPDERSIIVYISQFVQYYIKQLDKKTPLTGQNTVIKVVDEVNEEEELDSLELPISNVDSFNWEEVRADGISYLKCKHLMLTNKVIYISKMLVGFVSGRRNGFLYRDLDYYIGKTKNLFCNHLIV
jgi:hypothetical protein